MQQSFFNPNTSNNVSFYYLIKNYLLLKRIIKNLKSGSHLCFNESPLREHSSLFKALCIVVLKFWLFRKTA